MHNQRQQALLDTDRHRLVRAAARLLGPADAEDAVQEAYLRALESAPTEELNAAQAWLLTVVRNLSIDRLRRRQWLQQWLAEAEGGAHHGAEAASPSAEAGAALAQEALRALRLLAAHLHPADGAAVLLYAVFEASHAELAQASGKTEAASRQQLRRALLRLRQAGGTPPPEPHTAEEAMLRLYLQSLQQRDPQTLWALLNQPVVRAQAAGHATAAAAAAAAGMPASRAVASGIVQRGGQLGLVLTLDGVTLCVLPLGVRAASDAEPALQ